mmetsp:Transcript_1626/g.2004  ORF Transcript_1626/g.2004 Transcript_1626/m.2004 type:complete len:175 (+) Transcript_1626:32-556(+)
MEYSPLSLCRDQNAVNQASAVSLKLHLGEQTEAKQAADKAITADSLLKMPCKLAICVTMFNEPFDLLMMTLSGIYRTYYELVDKDKSFYEKVSIVIVSDGIKVLDKEFKRRLTKAGIYDETILSFVSNDSQEDELVPLELRHMNEDGYITKNLVHCFAARLRFKDLKKALTTKE